MGPATINTFYKEGIVREPADIYTLPHRNTMAAEREEANKEKEKEEKQKQKAIKKTQKMKKKMMMNITTQSIESNSEVMTVPSESEPVTHTVPSLPLHTLTGWGKKSSSQLLESIESRRSLPLDRFLMALGARHAGKETARQIALKFISLKALLTDIRSAGGELQSVNGVGPKATSSLLTVLGGNYTIVNNLLAEIAVTDMLSSVSSGQSKIRSDGTPVSKGERRERVTSNQQTDKNTVTPSESKTNVIHTLNATNNTNNLTARLESSPSAPFTEEVMLLTGKLYDKNHKDINRAQATRLCEQLGGIVVPSLTKRVTLVVTGDAPGPSKLKKIHAMGIPVISVSEWIDLLNTSGLDS